MMDVRALLTLISGKIAAVNMIITTSLEILAVLRRTKDYVLASVKRVISSYRGSTGSGSVSSESSLGNATEEKTNKEQ